MGDPLKRKESLMKFKFAKGEIKKQKLEKNANFYGYYNNPAQPFLDGSYTLNSKAKPVKRFIKKHSSITPTKNLTSVKSRDIRLRNFYAKR